MEASGNAPRSAPRSAPGEAPRERWRLLTTWDAAPGFNMALDEALLLAADSPPVLRLYTWRPDTLSLGYFQRWGDVPQAARAGAVVRRMTGGSAIHHANELTFSVAADQAHPVFRGPTADSYRRIHGIVARALAAWGVAAATREEATVSSDARESAMCFHHSTPVDLVWAGRKGVGSAQRRTRGRVLHHGSIKLGTTELEGDIATLAANARPGAPAATAEELGYHLVRAFSEALGIELDPDAPRPSESAHAEERAPHFTSDAFLRLR